MKKYVILTLLCIVFGMSTNAQAIPNGVYAYGYKNHYVFCVKNDTILEYNQYDGLDSYMGTYQFKDNKYYLSKNLLFGKNAILEKEPCSTDSIYIKMICKYQIQVFDGPMTDSTIYESESDFYSVSFGNRRFESHDKKGIFIPKGQLSQVELNNGFLFEENSWMMSCFRDYFSFPLEYGTRYIIKQNYFKFRPNTIFGTANDYYLFKFKKRNEEIWFKYNCLMCEEYEKLEYISPNCDSCFTAFKNRFPDLFK